MTTTPKPLDHQTPYFLATTALEQFWDTSRPILFLGEWCRLYDRKSFWMSLNGKIADGPWDTPQQINEALSYIDNVYERLLPALTDALNSVHGLHHSEKYWKILLGPWLKVFYLPTVYDRYKTIRTVIDRYPNITTTLLSEDSYITPRDLADFYKLINEDAYNLQLYSCMLKFAGKSYPEKPFEIEKNMPSPFALKNKSFQIQVAGIALKLMQPFMRILKNGHPVILRSSYFSKTTELQLIVQTHGKVWPLIYNNLQFRQFAPDNAARSKLRNLLIADNEFEAILNSMLPLDMLQVFIEGFNAVDTAVKFEYPPHAKAIFTANAWFFDEVFKQWAAACAETGSLLIGMQHGGNYGIAKFLPGLQHEIDITDRFYTWGWERPESPTKVVPFYASKLSGRKLMNADNRKKGILFLATSWPRYLLHFPSVPSQFIDYLLWQSRFLKSLAPELLPDLRVRCHLHDFGWDIAQRWKDNYADIKIENWGRPFLSSLDDCRVYVGDHLSTTFLEALSINKPTILFWDPRINELTPEAQPYFDLLFEAGIFFDSPEAAANAMNASYHDVERWWNDDKRQFARREICTRFARTSPHMNTEWAGEFNRIAKKGLTAASK